MNIEERKELFRRDIEAREAWVNGRRDLLCRELADVGYGVRFYQECEPVAESFYALPEHFPKTLRPLTPQEWFDAMMARRRLCPKLHNVRYEIASISTKSVWTRVVGMVTTVQWLMGEIHNDLCWEDTGKPCAVEVAE